MFVSTGLTAAGAAGGGAGAAGVGEDPLMHIVHSPNFADSCSA